MFLLFLSAKGRGVLSWSTVFRIWSNRELLKKSVQYSKFRVTENSGLICQSQGGDYYK